MPLLGGLRTRNTESSASSPILSCSRSSKRYFSTFDFEIYNRTKDRLLREDNTYGYPTYSEGKAVGVERLNRTLAENEDE